VRGLHSIGRIEAFHVRVLGNLSNVLNARSVTRPFENLLIGRPIPDGGSLHRNGCKFVPPTDLRIEVSAISDAFYSGICGEGLWLINPLQT